MVIFYMKKKKSSGLFWLCLLAITVQVAAGSSPRDPAAL
jgi:hypothetical protein